MCSFCCPTYSNVCLLALALLVVCSQECYSALYARYDTMCFFAYHNTHFTFCGYHKHCILWSCNTLHFLTHQVTTCISCSPQNTAYYVLTAKYCILCAHQITMFILWSPNYNVYFVLTARQCIFCARQIMCILCSPNYTIFYCHCNAICYMFNTTVLFMLTAINCAHIYGDTTNVVLINMQLV